MNINQVSDNITKWFAEHLTPDKLQAFQDRINEACFGAFNHNVQFYLSHLHIGNSELTLKLINGGLGLPMPDYFNETMGRTLQEIVRGMGG
jgi:hypothetical protein